MADSDHRDDFSFGGSFSDEHISGPSVGLQIGTPRVLWLALGATVSLVGLGLAAFLGMTLLPAVIGWALSGPVAIGLLAVFVHTETKRRAMPTYLGYAWVKPLYIATMALAMVAVFASALRIAFWVGRL